jgi:histidinol-phosphate aminotransferase
MGLFVYLTLRACYHMIGQTLAAVTPQTKLLFLCSPGNPTCKVIPLETISRMCREFPGIVVADEAYIDFCDASASALNLLHTYDNLVVLQTMSKAFGLAGIRLGMAMSGNAELIQLMNNVKAPYNINQLTSDMAIKALASDHTSKLKKETLPMILGQREKVMASLEALDFVTKVYPSNANFILFRLKHSAHEIYKRMADEGNVVSRYRGTETHCDECIRVTVGTPEENQTFLGQLALAWGKVEGSKK